MYCQLCKTTMLGINLFCLMGAQFPKNIDMVSESGGFYDIDCLQQGPSESDETATLHLPVSSRSEAKGVTEDSTK